jgi:hypothetical protein
MTAQALESQGSGQARPGTSSPATVLHQPPHQIAARLAQVIAEVLVRARPAAQLEPFAATAVVRLLERRADPPVLATAGGVPRPTVTSLRVSSPRAGAIEACAVIKVGRRHRALAYRIELSEAGWTCVAAQVG